MIVLSGVSGGLGREILADLLKLDTVLGIYNRSKPDFSTSAKLILEQLDVTDSERIKCFVEKWKRQFSRITVIHLAAIKVDGHVVQYDESDWDKVMDVNLKGNFLLTKALLPVMLHDGWGRIVHISSVGGLNGEAGTLAYGTSKTGLLGMSRALAKEYGRFNITSNILDLGYFETGMYTTLNESVKQKLLAQIPSRKLGKPSNIVNAIEFLIKSEYVNGAVINIDGGV